MQQFVLCKGCGNQLHEPPCMGECPIPQSVRCENCGLETICEDGTIEEAEQYEESKKEPLELPQLELEIDLEPETDEPQRSPDWSVLGPNIRRQRPSEVSAIRKIIPPVLGGLAAFPIATLIMWYGFGRDIGTAGPAVAPGESRSDGELFARCDPGQHRVDRPRRSRGRCRNCHRA